MFQALLGRIIGNDEYVDFPTYYASELVLTSYEVIAGLDSLVRKNSIAP